jgi:hypothetical protein
MDWNLKRRKRELEVADEVAGEFVQATKSMTQAAPPEFLIHHFALVCERVGFMPDEASTGRVLGYALKAIQRLRRQVDAVADKIDRLAAANPFDQATS